jgi:hypothetical protein
MNNIAAVKFTEYRITENGRKFMEGQNRGISLLRGVLGVRKRDLSAANHDAVTAALRTGNLKALKILRHRIPSLILTHDKVSETISLARYGALLATWHFRKMDRRLGWSDPDGMISVALDGDGNVI